jgi:hypothetical protein
MKKYPEKYTEKSFLLNIFCNQLLEKGLVGIESQFQIPEHNI